MNIGIWWDSITWWAFDYTGGGWANRVKLKFMKNLTKNWLEISCLGINGDITDELLYRFEVEAKARKCDVAIFAIWINDSCYIWEKTNNLVSIDKFEKNLNKLYKISLKLGMKKILFVWLTPVNEKLTTPLAISSKWKSYANDIIKIYDQTIKKLCNSNWGYYIDIMKYITLKDLDDGIHPNDKGHTKIANIIYNHIKNII